MLPISSLSSSVHSLISDSFCLVSSFSSQIVSKVLLPLPLSPFHCLQFLSNLPQYSLSYLLSNHLNSFFVVNYPGSSSLLNIFFFLSCHLTSSISYWYSFSNFLTTPFAFSKFSIPSQVSDSTVNSFYCTRYLSFSIIHCLFNILLTFHSFSSSIMIGASYSFLCPFTCPMYLCILLMLTTGCILIVLGSSSSTAFCYKSPKRRKVSQAFKHLIQNLKIYNRIEI